MGLCVFVVLAAGCSEDGDSETLWLKGLPNPFIGKWESKIPSTDFATVKFDYKQDGTFSCEFPAGPDATATAVGGYLVSGNVQVTFMSFDGGIGGYTFDVVDNNTINVTEIDSVDEETGSITAGNTAAFTRTSGSAVNTANKPFVLENDLIGGTWKETTTPYQAEYTFNANGTGTMKYQAGGQSVTSNIAYCAFNDQGINKDVLVTYIPGMNAFTPYSFAFTANGGGGGG